MRPSYTLFLYHGRKSPDEQPEDWGPEGPTILGVDSIHVTYLQSFYFRFIDWASFQAAITATGWEVWDASELCLRATVEDDLVRARFPDGSDGWFGDWSLTLNPFTKSEG
jgi:hypothetical protein